MARLTEAAETPEELFLDEELAGQAAEIEAVLAKVHGDPRAAVGALVIRVAEVERARLEAAQSVSLGYRRGLQPARTVRE